jgi:uncharacterized damage-inducible protein DinB
MTRRLLSFAVVSIAAAACSQQPPPPPPPAPPSTAIISSVRIPYEATKGFITKTAEQVPEAKYTYQPTKEVRTIAQLLAHIADASYLFCGVASSEKPPQGAGTAEKSLTKKADIQKALADAFGYCDRAFASLNDTTGAAAAVIEPINNLKTTKIGALAFDAAHNYEHYGNLVTYMRINKMVPPSSQGPGGK